MRSSRKLLAAREDLANKISELAKKKGWTLYELVNEVLEEAIRAESMGTSLKEVLDEFSLLREAKESGLLLVPSRLWHDIIDKCYETLSKDWLTSLWYECGQWYGKYYEDVEKLVKAFKRFFWDVASVDSLIDGNIVYIKVFFSNPSLPYVELFSKFVEGALDSLGYKLVNKNVVKGALSTSFVKKVAR